MPSVMTDGNTVMKTTKMTVKGGKVLVDGRGTLFRTLERKFVTLNAVIWKLHGTSSNNPFQDLSLIHI